MAITAEAIQTEAKSRRLNPWLKGETWFAFLFILPSMIGFILFYAVPAVRGLLISFTNWDLLTPAQPVGLANYQKLITDVDFWKALWVTLNYVVINIFVQTALAILIAVLMDRLTKSIVVRGVLILPYLFSNVVVALLWLWMLDPTLGIVNSFLEFIGIGRQPFLGAPSQAIASVAWINIWRHMGYTALLVFAGLQTIPKDVYEAGAIDGAGEFQKQHPNIKIKIEQSGWGDYWSNLQTGMVAGNAPDVFTDHLAKYPEFAAKNQIMDIQPLVDRDKVPTDIYIGKLADLWTREGKRYGLPKDWDTVAVFYNKKMLEDAGIDPKIMEDWTWNPQDGGTFEETIAKLTLDENGNNGLSPDFDKTKVKQYGFIPQGLGGPYGQTQWSPFTVSNGFKFQDELWGTKFYYDDPKFTDTLQWYTDLWLKKGYAPTYPDVKSLGGGALFQAGKGAITTDGSWNIQTYIKNSNFEIGFGLLPVGPEGRKSMFNGLADSIYIGSKHPDEAWEWVKFLASPACQNIVGGYAVVFPAIQSGVDKALEAHKKNGLDVSPFTAEALDPNGTFLFPVADHAAEITTIMNQTEEKVNLGETTDIPGAYKQANDEVNALFQ